MTFKDHQKKWEERKMGYWNRFNQKLHDSGNPGVWIHEFYDILDEVSQSQKKEIVEMIEGMKKEANFNAFGDPHYQCYRLTGHEYDSFGYCKICHNPHPEAKARAENNLPAQYNQALTDIIKKLEE